MKTQTLSIVGAAVALLLAGASHAAASGPQRTATGSYGDMSWEARSLIVGMTPTAAGDPTRYPGQGDPIFSNNLGAYTGVVPIIMFYEGVGSFICTASLLPDRVSLLTAAHCVSDGAGTPGPTTTTAFFQQNLGPSDRPPTDGVATPITVSQYFVNAGYTGQVIDHNDIAVLRLSAPAPDWAQSYGMSFAAGLRGTNFTVAGYGNRSLVGGGGPTGGATAGTTGFLRHGDNMFDYRMGDPAFSQIPGNGWQTVFPNNPNIAYSYLSDFDSGLAANDTACRVAQASNLAGAAGVAFCDLGRGASEVSVAGGDSGGPQFNAAGQIVSITSYGLSFGPSWGDCRSGLQSSCGEFNGFVPLYIHQAFITAAMIPEPETYALMLLGLGAVGAVARRRRQAA
jgi:V8-like Glu-specific endopeptidase